MIGRTCLAADGGKTGRTRLLEFLLANHLAMMADQTERTDLSHGGKPVLEAHPLRRIVTMM